MNLCYKKSHMMTFPHMMTFHHMMTLHHMITFHHMMKFNDFCNSMYDGLPSYNDANPSQTL